jgi:hypothetical protein
MKNPSALGVMLVSLSAAVVALAGSGPSACPETTTPAAAGGGPSGVAAGAPAGTKPARLRDLKLALPKGWKAEYKEGSVEWIVEKNAPPNYPTVYIAALLPTREPKDFADFVRKVQAENDPYGLGYRWSGVSEKGQLPDGYYVVGPVKLSTDKEARGTGLAILRALGGRKLLFECFKINDAAERKEVMDWCKAANF